MNFLNKVILHISIFAFQMSQSKMDIEHSELLLYQNMVLKESGQLRESLKYLDDNDQLICDKLTVKEIKGKVFSCDNI